MGTATQLSCDWPSVLPCRSPTPMIVNGIPSTRISLPSGSPSPEQVVDDVVAHDASVERVLLVGRSKAATQRDIDVVQRHHRRRVAAHARVVARVPVVHHLASTCSALRPLRCRSMQPSLIAS